jgi:hypothetical protein
LPRLKTSVALGLGVLMLAGCGSARPGVAIEIDDKTVSLAQVSENAEALCTGLAPLNEAAGVREPRSNANSTAASLATQGLMAQMLFDEFGLVPSPEFTQSVATLRQQAAEQGVAAEYADAVVDILTAQYRLQDAKLQLGAAALEGQDPASITQEQAFELGSAFVSEWAQDKGIEIDPRFGIEFVEGTFAVAATRTSTSVSELALVAEDPERSADLPSNLLCGSE